MKKFLALIASSFLMGVSIWWRLNSLPTLSMTAQAEVADIDPACKVVGNNLAVYFDNPKNNFDEAPYTLALMVSGSEAEKKKIIDVINGTDQTVIVRLGAGLGSPSIEGYPPEKYGADLNEIAAKVAENGRSFIATAGHNEPNCAEYIPLGAEVDFVQKVNGVVNADNVKLITGQIDYYCGASPGASPDEYASALLTASGKGGLAVPFYTGVAGGSQATIDAYHAFVDKYAVDIYVTESGPFRGELSDFASAVAGVINDPKIKAFLLFNAQGGNKDENFKYTKPFWNINCRKAFRTVCQNPEEVIKRCGSTTSDYYLYPIAGLKEGNPNQIAADLVQQGYEISCTTPKFDIEAKTGGDLQRYFELFGDATQVFPLDPSLIFDYSSAGYPLFRSDDNTALMSSLETFFGFQDTSGSDTFEQKINSSPFYTLLGQERQCIQKIKILETIEKLCAKLDNPDSCALYQPVPATTYTTDPSSLLAEWRSKNLTCQQIIVRQTDTFELQKIKGAVMRVPMFMDRAYRLAFLVITTELKEDKSPTSFFNFLRKSNRSAGPKHEVKALAFKIPDIGTNRDLNSDTNYLDPLQMTRNLVQEHYEFTKDIADFEARRRDQIERLQSGLTTPLASYPIECADPPTCASLQDPLLVALAHMINENGQSCEAGAQDLKYEDVDTISSDTSLEQTDGTTFKPDAFKMVDNLFENTPTGSASGASSPSRAEFNFFSTIKVGKKVSGDGKTPVKAYLVYPVGEELATVEDTLAALVYDLKGVQAFKADENNARYLPLLDAEADVETQRPQFGFTDPNCGPGTVSNDPNSEDPTGCRKDIEAYVEADTADAGPRVEGGWLGQILLMIEKTVHINDTKVYRYLNSCETTEDFLLGRCGGNDEGSGDSDDNDNVGGACIDVWTDGDLRSEYAAALRKTLPLQQDSSSSFAGWAPYFGVKPESKQFQHLWGTCGGTKPCYDYVLDRVLAESDINPYLAIAIALNETGGLFSRDADKTGPHFGCAPWKNDTIENKLTCLITTLNNYKTRDGLSDDAALRKYGYVNGAKNKNLNKIMSILSDGTYQGGTCE